MWILNKIVSIKNTNAIFLATVIVLGTIATISPSLMVGAQAEPDDEKDNDKDNDKDNMITSSDDTTT